MEFPNLGKHCSLDTCNQLDLLPFTCDACKKVYCREHVRYENHECQMAQNKDRRVPVCPLCNQPISLSAAEQPDQKVNEHIENDCKSDLAKHKRSNRCRVKGCKQRELIPVLCSSCKQNFCLRHRHENDHDCQAKPNSQRNNQSSAGLKAGRAAAAHFNKTPTTNKKLQQSTLSNVGADLNCIRNERRSQTSPGRTTVTHRNDMSEDEALALAMQASLADSSFRSEPTRNTPLSQQEREDQELAQALAQSEKDERERQRRTQQSQKSKDSCAIS